MKKWKEINESNFALIDSDTEGVIAYLVRVGKHNTWSISTEWIRKEFRINTNSIEEAKKKAIKVIINEGKRINEICEGMIKHNNELEKMLKEN